MMHALGKLGLRGKLLLALALACLLALLAAALLGGMAVRDIRDHLGLAFARDQAQLARHKLQNPVSRELALSLRLADSELTRRWLSKETDPALRELMFREAEGFRRDFRDQSYFLISNASRAYYFNDAKQPLSVMPRYVLDPEKSQDAWYFATVASKVPYNINVNLDQTLGITKVWINALVRDGELVLGLAGSGLDLTTFLQDFLQTAEAGVTPFAINEHGAIQAHRKKERIAYASGAGMQDQQNTVWRMLGSEAEQQQLRMLMQQSKQHAERAQTMHAVLDGKPQLLAVSYLPELQWYVLTAVDLDQAHIFDFGKVLPLLGVLALLFLLLLVGFAYAVDHLLLRPLQRLQQSTAQIALGDYALQLPGGGQDEIGALTRAFAVMAAKVQQYTESLEAQVRQRTQALEQANLLLTNSNKKLSDSIEYASLIQRAILPDRQMTSLLGDRHFVLWRPRDVVGGDFYVFRPDGENSLIGVVDCAGHGVPGALMTMLARAAIDHALAEVGPRDPAQILHRTDIAIRTMLADAPERTLATNMDAALVYVDVQNRQISFAGAKMSLYWSDGETVEEIAGDRRALGDRRRIECKNIELPLVSSRCYYLASDGVLDQAGGEHGYGLGNRRFGDMLRQLSKQPMGHQAAALLQALSEYQGQQAQRDDITILCFRID